MDVVGPHDRVADPCRIHRRRPTKEIMIGKTIAVFNPRKNNIGSTSFFNLVRAAKKERPFYYPYYPLEETV
ncbi:hypothetical protein KM043_006771 [Ampulex compressa]|nr:hypothetical protein KM043_006771 [Ampulex compressa]